MKQNHVVGGYNFHETWNMIYTGVWQIHLNEVFINK